MTAEGETRKPWEYGGEGYEHVEYGHRFDCANEPGHEEHATYDDQNTVQPWDVRRLGEPWRCKRINGHPVVVVSRIVAYGPWVDTNDA